MVEGNKKGRSLWPRPLFLIVVKLFFQLVKPFVDGAVDFAFALAFRVFKAARLGLVVIVGRVLTRFNVFDGIGQALGDFLEIFLVEENLVLLIEEAVQTFVKTALAFGYGDVLFVVFC